MPVSGTTRRGYDYARRSGEGMLGERGRVPPRPQQPPLLAPGHHLRTMIRLRSPSLLRLLRLLLPPPILRCVEGDNDEDEKPLPANLKEKGSKEDDDDDDGDDPEDDGTKKGGEQRDSCSKKRRRR